MPKNTVLFSPICFEAMHAFNYFASGGSCFCSTCDATTHHCQFIFCMFLCTEFGAHKHRTLRWPLLDAQSEKGFQEFK